MSHRAWGPRNITNLFDVMNVSLDDIVEEYNKCELSGQTPVFEDGWMKILETFQSNLTIDPDIVRRDEIQSQLELQFAAFKNLMGMPQSDPDHFFWRVGEKRIDRMKLYADAAIAAMHSTHLMFELANEMMRSVATFAVDHKRFILCHLVNNQSLIFKYMRQKRNRPKVTVEITVPETLSFHYNLLDMKYCEVFNGNVYDGLPFVKIVNTNTSNITTNFVTRRLVRKRKNANSAGNENLSSGTYVTVYSQDGNQFANEWDQPKFFRPREFYPEFFDYVKRDFRTIKKDILFKYRSIMETYIKTAFKYVTYAPLSEEVLTSGVNELGNTRYSLIINTNCSNTFGSGSFNQAQVLNMIETQRKWLLEFKCEMSKYIFHKQYWETLCCKIHGFQFVVGNVLRPCHNCIACFEENKTLISILDSMCQLTNNMFYGACMLNKNTAAWMGQYFIIQSIETQQWYPNLETRFKGFWNKIERIDSQRRRNYNVQRQQEATSSMRM